MANINFELIKSDKQIVSLVDMAKNIWTEHYTPIIGKKQVEYMLDKYQSEDAIKSQISEGYQYYLVYLDNKVCGYFSYRIDKETYELFVSKIYLHKDYRGKKISKKIFAYIQKKASSNNLNSIYLTVNKENTDSIKAYIKNGFINEKSIITDIGSGFVMDDYLLRKNIK